MSKPNICFYTGRFLMHEKAVGYDQPHATQQMNSHATIETIGGEQLFGGNISKSWQKMGSIFDSLIVIQYFTVLKTL